MREREILHMYTYIHNVYSIMTLRERRRGGEEPKRKRKHCIHPKKWHPGVLDLQIIQLCNLYTFNPVYSIVHMYVFTIGSEKKER